MTALRNAWRIAGALGHHWAQSATPARLAAAAWYRDHHDCADAPDAPDAWADDTGDPVPPASHAEAVLLGHLPAHVGGGIRVPEPTGGVYVDGTGSGRAHWACYPDGRVHVRIDRPMPGRPCWPDGDPATRTAGYTVMYAVYTPGEGTEVTLRDRAERRHFEALYEILAALEPEPEEIWFHPQADTDTTAVRCASR